MTQRIYCIDPATHTPEKDTYRHICSLVPSSFKLTYHLPALEKWEKILLHEKMSPAQGVIILGSSSSIYDQKPWQIMLMKWLEKKMRQQVPILGICFGHQMIFHMLGSKIRKLSKKQSGTRVIHFMADSPIKFQKEKKEIVVSHQEIATTLPNEMNLMANSNLFDIEAAYHKTQPIYTVQGHPEATNKFCQNQNISIPSHHHCFNHGAAILDSIFREFATEIKKRRAKSPPFP